MNANEVRKARAIFVPKLPRAVAMLALGGLGFFVTQVAVAAVVAIENAKVATATSAGIIENGAVHVTDGVISWVGPTADAPALATDAQRVDAQGHWVTPGLIESHTELGLVEISAEASSSDVRVEEFSMGPGFDVRYALNPASVLLSVARASGITSAVVAPGAGNDPLAGVGVAISLHETLDPAELLLATDLALFGGLNSRAAQFVGGSRGALIVRLREALTSAKSFSAARYIADKGGYTAADLAALQRWRRSGAPLALGVNQAGQILQALSLAQEFKFSLIILGGAEAWKVAPQLAAAKVPVVLDAMANIPVDFDALGARLENAALLHKAGVAIALTSENTHNAGWIRQGGGIAVANGLPYAAALNAITSGPAKIWGLKDRGELARGKVADLVVWSGDPLEVTTHAERVMINGEWTSLETRQDRLRERYRDVSNTATPFGYR